MLIAWMGIGGLFLGALISYLAVRATKRSTADTKAANELAARDRLLEARDRDVAARDRTIEQRDRLIDQIQEERDRTFNAKDAQIHEQLDRIDLLTGQVRTLEEQNAALRSKP